MESWEECFSQIVDLKTSFSNAYAVPLSTGYTVSFVSLKIAKGQCRQTEPAASSWFGLRSHGLSPLSLSLTLTLTPTLTLTQTQPS